MNRTAQLVLSGLIAAALACGCNPLAPGANTQPDAGAAVDAGTGAGADAGPGPATALFEVPRGAPPPSGFYALPFPNDIRIADSDGHIDLSDYPSITPLIDSYIAAIQAHLHGFGLSSAVFLRFNGAIDPSSLPQTPADAESKSASVYLVDIDPGSAAVGQRWPVRFRFDREKNDAIGADWLSVLPYPGFPLRDNTTYAVIVTDRVRATDGSPVAPAADFQAIAAAAKPSDPALARAQMIYAPLWQYLDQSGGDGRSDVVSAAVFTTQDATGLMGKIRQVIYNQVPVPSLQNPVKLTDGADFHWFDGDYEGPNFQRGTVPYHTEADGGDIVVDPKTGMPVVQRMEDLRVSFTVPKGTVPASGWPIVLYAHGTGGDYHTFHDNGTAERLAKQGLAVIGIDQVLHGARNPNGNPELDFFNFENPLAARDNTLQGALDDFQLVRLARSIDYTDPSGIHVKFDPNRIYFFGHSQGGLTGPPFLAYEPLVKGAVLSGAAGLVYLSLLLKTQPVNVAAFVQLVIPDRPLDEFDPLLSMLQMYLDRADPVSYGPLLVRRPPQGIDPKQIFQSEGFVDHYAPQPGIEAFATSIGEDPVSPVLGAVPGLALRGRTVLDPPVSGNQNGITSVLLQYQQASGSDGHFVLFDVPVAERQSAQFLGSLAQSGTATVVAP